jgi:hypothetical protein
MGRNAIVTTASNPAMEVASDGESRRPLVEPRRFRGRVLFAAKALALTAVLAFLVHTLTAVEWSQSLASVRNVGALAFLVFLPFPVGLFLETRAWQLMLGRLSCRVSLGRLFRTRLATDALTVTMPAGGLLAEAAGPVLLAPATPIEASLAAGIAKRWLIVRTHGLYVIAAGLLGFSTLSQKSRSLLGHGWAAWLVIGAGILLVALSFAVQRGASSSGVADRARGALERLAASRLFGSLVSGERGALHELGDGIGTLARSPHIAPAALLFGQWLFEAIGSFVILRLLGVQMSLQDVMAIDATLSVVRAVAVFAPAGVGVQDLGYLAFFGAYDVANVGIIGPAFLVLKRLREMSYVIVGMGLLLWSAHAAKGTGVSS